MRIKSYDLKLKSFRRATPEKLHKTQQYIDNEIIRRSDPLVPFKTGTLKRSGIWGTKIGTGVIEYIAPYARIRYFVGKPKGLRGTKWTRRMWLSNKDDIIQNAQKIINKGK